jgi:hypothetical protein
MNSMFLDILLNLFKTPGYYYFVYPCPSETFRGVVFVFDSHYFVLPFVLL